MLLGRITGLIALALALMVLGSYSPTAAGSKTNYPVNIHAKSLDGAIDGNDTTGSGCDESWKKVLPDGS